MHTLLDILASGVHDTKNQLFLAESLLSEAERTHGINLSEARYAIESAATRLSRSLAAYRLSRDGNRLSVRPVIVADLIEEVALEHRPHLEKLGLTLETACPVIDEWAFDRDLVADMLNNALQNAARFARQRVQISAGIEDDFLVLRVNDDGPGYTTLPPDSGIGLQLATRLATRHLRQEKSGSLTLDNGGSLGGALFMLRLP